MNQLPPLRTFKVRYLPGGPNSTTAAEVTIECHRVALDECGHVCFEMGIVAPDGEGMVRHVVRGFSQMVFIDKEEVLKLVTPSGLIIQ